MFDVKTDFKEDKIKSRYKNEIRCCWIAKCGQKHFV